MWWHWRLGNACDIRAWHLCVEIAVEPIALHSDVFRLLRAKGPVMCLPLLSNVLHTQSFATPCFTHRFVTHHLSHTTLSHALFHTQLSHTPSFTHSFVTPFFFVSHTIFHIPLCLPQLFTYNLFYFSIIHHILCLSFLPRPPYNICRSLLEEVDLSGHPVL